MLAEKIFRVRAFLGTLAGHVDEEDWKGIKSAQDELKEAERLADQLESTPLCLAANDNETGPRAIAACTFAE